MPYKCVHCSAVYDDEAKELIDGCSSEGCKSKFFFYIQKEKLKEIEKKKEAEAEKLSASEKKQIEKDVRDISGVQNEETPIFLDFESIKIIKPGKYVIDVAKLFDKNKPRIYKLEDGKYIVDLMALQNKKQSI